MGTIDEQITRLKDTVGWARQIRATLQPLIDEHGERVHFRPGSTGVSMVGLLPSRPQRGKSGLRKTSEISADFEALFARYCENIEQGRVTGEKALQSFLIRESFIHARRIDPINQASLTTSEPVELTFVTDEISLPISGGKIVCDLLALRRDGGRCTPVLLELKDDRLLSRLVEQVEGFAPLVDTHAPLFADLFSALIGEPVVFDAPCERWIVWPGVSAKEDPREHELAAKQIRVVSYMEDHGSYAFRVGESALNPTKSP